MPSPVDLTDLDAVRVFLQKEDINTDQDDIIQALITAASRAIAERFQREFVDSGAGATRKFLVEDLAPYWIEAGNVDLAPYDLNAGNPITVKIDPQDGGGITLTEWTDYVLKPLPTKHGVYMRIELLGPRARRPELAPRPQSRHQRHRHLGVPRDPRGRPALDQRRHRHLAAQGRRRLLQRLPPRRGPGRARLNAARRRDGRPRALRPRPLMANAFRAGARRNAACKPCGSRQTVVPPPELDRKAFDAWLEQIAVCPNCGGRRRIT
jgi:hypothetical protein